MKATRRVRLTDAQRKHRDQPEGGYDVLGWHALADLALEEGNDRSATAWRLRAQMAEAVLSVVGDRRLTGNKDEVVVASRSQALKGRKKHARSARHLFGDDHQRGLGRFEVIGYRTENHVKILIRDDLHPARPRGLSDSLVFVMPNAPHRRREEKQFWVEETFLDLEQATSRDAVMERVYDRCDSLLLWHMADDAPRDLFDVDDVGYWLKRHGFDVMQIEKGAMLYVSHPRGRISTHEASLGTGRTADHRPLVYVWTEAIEASDGVVALCCAGRHGTIRMDNPYEFLRLTYRRCGAQAIID